MYIYLIMKLKNMSFNRYVIYMVMDLMIFISKDSKIEEIKIENKDKINILITHGSLNASKYNENAI